MLLINQQSIPHIIILHELPLFQRKKVQTMFLCKICDLSAMAIDCNSQEVHYVQSISHMISS